MESVFYSDAYVVVQFYPWFKFYFLLLLGIAIYCFFRGHGNESCNLIGSLPGQYFPISAHGQR